MRARVKTLRGALDRLAEALRSCARWFTIPRAYARFLDSEERHTQAWMAYARFALVGIFLFFTLVSVGEMDSRDEFFWDVGTTLAFVPAGLIQLWIARFNRPNRWVKYVIITTDVIMLSYLATTIPPYAEIGGLAGTVEESIRAYRDQDMQILYIFYAWVLVSQSARFVTYFGFLLWMAWLGQMISVLVLPDVFTVDNLPEILQGAPQSVIERHPRYVDPDIAVQNMGLVFVLTLSFIVVIRRTRSLTSRLFKAEQSRSALSRYFSPDVVDRVISDGDTGACSNRRDTVILFADLVDFTREAEALPPHEVFELLREFHGEVEKRVFSHNGTLEKYIGDAVLATFGGLEGNADDACRALSCALSLQEAMADLNARRIARGARPLELAIGLHYGPTVSGIIGEGRNMAFVVTGAAVAIANRVQSEARRLNADLVLSDSFAARCRAEGDCEVRMRGFDLEPACRLKGLTQPVSLWYRRRLRSVDDRAVC